MKSEIESRFSIHSPLFVFDRVFRRTGTIQKTCIFHNASESDLDLEVKYGFQEHSWLQIVRPPGDGRDATRPIEAILGRPPERVPPAPRERPAGWVYMPGGSRASSSSRSTGSRLG